MSQSAAEAALPLPGGDVGVQRAGTSSDLRMRNLAALARAVHLSGGRRTRAELTKSIGVARGTAAVLTADLTARELITERPGPGGGRGRPTGIAGPHPRGPVAIAVDLRDESWTVAAGELGGALTVLDQRGHQARPADQVLGTLADVIAERVAASGMAHRVIGLAVALPATIGHGRILQAVHLNWPPADVAGTLRAALDAESARARTARGEIPGASHFTGGRCAVENDATLAGLAEARRGRLRGTHIGLHLHTSLGIGGVLVADGRPVTGALGVAGEFGHMPLAGSDLACPCGARGCWDVEVGANALLRRADVRVPPGGGIAAAGQLIRRAADGDPDAMRAVGACAAALGRGAAALVNAHDPQIVTLSGLARGLAGAAPGILHNAYLAGLMRFRRTEPPPLHPSGLTMPGPLVGAAELVFDEFLTSEGLSKWPYRTG